MEKMVFIVYSQSYWEHLVVPPMILHPEEVVLLVQLFKKLLFMILIKANPINSSILL
jgi:hypothetical protein